MLRHLALIAIAAAPLFHPAMAQDADEVALARDVLAALQPVSFDKRREYCGYLGLTRQGELVASAAVPGDMASCSADFPDDIAVIASYHTHGAFDEGYFNEMPSTVDVESDAEFFLNGYVATPGGRLWHIDGRTRVARQICGSGCLPVAPGYRKEADGEIAETYTLDELRRIQE
ncbi:protein of unknown function [Loktanella fryxellensis]|uniref:DUF4329 domain-containing protein n=1 Tax=Loktanella fryxellensis TaxID=245187 RepID=A0A1H8DFB2_9RHOB|nr:DUF4329 domain-containing protein [Loktanella fryxellensis]SEN05795.1 protein of unknown function [Loktanella fryxellensis]